MSDSAIVPVQYDLAHSGHLGPGIYLGVPDHVYHRDPCPEPSLSSSMIKKLTSSSPLHASRTHPRLNPNWEEQNWRAYSSWSAQLKGKVIHEIALLGEGTYGIIEADDYRKNATKAERDRIVESGRVPVLRKHFEAIEQAIPHLKRGMEILEPDDGIPVFQDGAPEVTIIWFDEEFRCWCRARPDWLRYDLRAMDDLKTSTTARPDTDADGWGKIGYSNGIDIQQVFYQRGVKALFPDADPKFRFVVFEHEDPYDISQPSLGAVGVFRGKALVSRGMQLWAECLEKNRWPGHPKTTTYIDPPAYLVRMLEEGGRLEDREALEF